jgi:hypothetical protein
MCDRSSARCCVSCRDCCNDCRRFDFCHVCAVLRQHVPHMCKSPIFYSSCVSVTLAWRTRCSHVVHVHLMEPMLLLSCADSAPVPPRQTDTCCAHIFRAHTSENRCYASPQLHTHKLQAVLGEARPPDCRGMCESDLASSDSPMNTPTMHACFVFNHSPLASAFVSITYGHLNQFFSMGQESYVVSHERMHKDLFRSVCVCVCVCAQFAIMHTHA